MISGQTRINHSVAYNRIPGPSVDSRDVNEHLIEVQVQLLSPDKSVLNFLG